MAAGSVGAGMLGSTYAGNCLLDSFTAQGASTSSNPPTVCGTLTGQHEYIEADTDRCNKLTFHFADGVSTDITETNARGLIALATRSWDVTATQIECTSLTLPPPGCTQYFYGGGKYTLTTANWLTAGTSWHLANQHDRFCIRRERGNCIGCFVATALTNFMLSGQERAFHYTMPGGCCGYATSAGSIFGANALSQDSQGLGDTDALIANENVFNYGYDCIIIPGAFGPANNGGIEGVPDAAQAATDLTQTLRVANQFPHPWPPQICGSSGGIGIGSDTLEEAAFDMEEALNDGEAYMDDIGGTVLEFGIGINLSICTRNTPFTLEFMSDDLEGVGGESTQTEWEDATANRGFTLVATQVACA